MALADAAGPARGAPKAHHSLPPAGRLFVAPRKRTFSFIDSQCSLVSRVQDGRAARSLGARWVRAAKFRSRGSYETCSQGLLLAFVVLLVLLVAAGAALAAKPTRVMIVVMDQMQPGYAEKYDMNNVLWLQNKGVNYPNAWVGDMASETVVSHNVMVSGLYPSTWAGPTRPSVTSTTSSATARTRSSRSATSATADYLKLIQADGLPQARRLPARQVPGHDRRQRRREGLPGRVHGRLELGLLGPHGQQEEDRRPRGPERRPVDRHVPRRRRQPAARTSRATTATRSASATTSRRRVPHRCRTTTTAPRSTSRPGGIRRTAATSPGPYADHLSGDTWVADAAIDIMDGRTEGLVRPLGDLQRHRQGRPHVGRRRGRHGGELQLDSRHALRADPHAVGREDRRRPARPAHRRSSRPKGQFDDTLIVVTADHGSTYGGKGDHGDNVYDGGNVGRLVRRHLVPGLRPDPTSRTRPPARPPSSRSWTRARSSSATSPPPSSRGSRWTTAAGATGSPWRAS